MWGCDDDSTMRLSISKVRRNVVRVRLFDVFYRGKRARVSNVRLTARTLHFEGLAPSSGTEAIFHLSLKKDGSLLNRQTLFETWVRE